MAYFHLHFALIGYTIPVGMFIEKRGRGMQTRYLTTTLIAMLLASGVSARTVVGNGHVVEEVRPAGDFHAIQSSGGFVLDVTAGPAVSIKLKGDDNLLAQIETRISNGQLIIKQGKDDDEVHIQDGHVVHITVTTPKFDAFSGEGAGKIVFHGISADNFAMTYGGAGLVTASGNVRNLTVDSNGAGSLDLKSLKSNNATVNINGVGAMNIYASDTLTAAVNGIASLTYFGHPTHRNTTVNGIGSVNAGD
jgi:hypothetical protein